MESCKIFRQYSTNKVRFKNRERAEEDRICFQSLAPHNCQQNLKPNHALLSRRDAKKSKAGNYSSLQQVRGLFPEALLLIRHRLHFMVHMSKERKASTSASKEPSKGQSQLVWVKSSQQSLILPGVQLKSLKHGKNAGI